MSYCLGEGLLQDLQVVSNKEEVNSPFDDMRAASEYWEDDWVEETETLFTLPEILLLFQ